MGKSMSTGTANIPAEATSKASVNESLNNTDKDPKSEIPKDLDDGPMIGELGQRLPAVYKRIWKDKKTKEIIELIVRDR